MRRGQLRLVDALSADADKRSDASSTVRLQPVPDELRTARLRLRRWRPSDAPLLAPILAANTDHLDPWIPRRVAEPGTVEQIVERLSFYHIGFDAGREWRYALFGAEDAGPLGEISLFPRDASGRVPFDRSDHIELGYWLRVDATGRGLATEAAAAALALALSLPRIERVTIHCDERNAASAAVPRRLGFRLATHESEPGMQTWEYGAAAGA